MSSLVETGKEAGASVENKEVSGRLSIFAGVLRRCTNRDLLYYPAAKKRRMEIREEIRALVQKHFTVVDVFFSNYGPNSGPGIIVTLAESTLVIGGWPDKNNSVDFFLHYCGDNDAAAVACAHSLKAYAGAHSIVFSRLTKEPTYLLTV